MLKSTHTYIADILWKKLFDDKYKKYRKFYLYGNIYPDTQSFKREYVYPHYYKYSKEFVFEIFQNILNKEYNMEETFVMIGVINHFIADFFCHSHNKDYCLRYKDFRFIDIPKWLEHYRYEALLDRYMKKNLKKYSNDDIEEFSYDADLTDFMKIIIERYLEEDNKNAADIKYTIAVCNKINKIIYEESLNK